MKTISLFWLLLSGLLLGACHKREGAIERVLPPQKSPVDILVLRSTLSIPNERSPQNKSSWTVFFDVTGGQVYTTSTATAHTPEVDFCWMTGDSVEGLFSLDAPELRFQNSSATAPQKRTLLARTEKISIADFEMVQTTTQLLRLWNRDKPMNTFAPFTASPADTNEVYLFETAQHKRGLLRFVKPHTGTSGCATFQTKMEP